MNSTDTRNLKYWWIPLLFGIIFVVTGIWILQSPAESFEKITKLIGIIILVSGTAELILTLYSRRGIPGWGYQLVGGFVDIGIGLILILNPTILLKLITIFVAIWLMISGVMVLVHGSESKKAGSSFWKWEFVMGALLIVLAIILLWHPMVIGLTIAIWTALAFIVLGVFRIALTIKLKNHHSVRERFPS